MLTSEQSEKLEQFLELIIAEKAHLGRELKVCPNNYREEN